MRATKGNLLAALLVVGWMGSAHAAACRDNEYLAQIGDLQTGSAVISTQAHEVRLINVTCTSTACIAGLYDTDTLETAFVTTAAVVIEPGAPASQTALVPQSGFFAQPLSFTEGITFVDDGNVEAIALFECRER